MKRFIAALDQSGGYTPSALDTYGAPYTEDNMFDVMHDFRMRIINNKLFTHWHLMGAIVFQHSLENGIVNELDSRRIRTYLKIDSGVEEDGSFKDMPFLAMFKLADQHGCTGIKMRSIIHSEDKIDYILEEQFAVAAQATEMYGLIPIIEPEILIGNADKAAIEAKLAEKLPVYLDERVTPCMLKLTIPDVPNTYSTAMNHEQCNTLLGLSGGYDLETSCTKLNDNVGMVASFSRALVEGLTFEQTDEEFHEKLSANIYQITHAS